MKKCRRHRAQTVVADPRLDTSPGAINYVGRFYLVWCGRCHKVLRGTFMHKQMRFLRPLDPESPVVFDDEDNA